MATPPVIRIGFWFWLLAALVAGRLGLLQRLPPSAGLGIPVALTGGLIVAYRGLGFFRAWVDALDLRAIVLVHATRFVGLYFLVLHRRGELPHAFAVSGAIGDIAVAAFAVVAVFFPCADATRRRVISIWNVVGFIDLVVVMVAAARIGAAGGRDLIAFADLPLSLLPTFLVPLLIASHLALFARLVDRERA